MPSDSQLPDAPPGSAPCSGSETARKAKVLLDMLANTETRWAENLTDAELADELIANLWADIPWRERKKCALLTAAIDRLKAKSPNRPS